VTWTAVVAFLWRWRRTIAAGLLRLARSVAAEPSPTPTVDTLTVAMTDAAIVAELVPESYLLATLRYGFLPARSTQLDVTWVELSPIGRVAFLLNYAAKLYARTPQDLALLARLGDRPTIVYRTADHPEAGGVMPAPHQPAYSLFFDTDSGRRIELHLGLQSYLGLAMVMTGTVAPEHRRRAARTS
jgi:hypothetical protein